MAERPAAKPVAQPDSEWETVQPDEWQTVTQPSVPQRGESLTAIEPHQSDTPVHALEDVFGNIGAGGMSALSTLGRISPWGAAADYLMGEPTIYQEGLHAIENPKQTGKMALEAGKSMAAHPMETIEGGIGAAGAMGSIPAMSDAIDAIPSTARAGRILQEIRNQGAEVPVTMTKTQEPLGRFEELTQAGGRRSKPFTQLYKRTQMTEPVNFPEARDFYTNMNDATHQTTLMKWMGRGMKPQMRQAGLAAKHALNEDLTNAAEGMGRGEDYTNAMREYAKAKRLHRILKVGAGLAAGEAARRTGLLGNWIHRTALQQ